MAPPAPAEETVLLVLKFATTAIDSDKPQGRIRSRAATTPSDPAALQAEYGCRLPPVIDSDVAYLTECPPSQAGNMSTCPIHNGNTAAWVLPYGKSVQNVSAAVNILSPKARVTISKSNGSVCMMELEAGSGNGTMFGETASRSSTRPFLYARSKHLLPMPRKFDPYNNGRDSCKFHKHFEPTERVKYTAGNRWTMERPLRTDTAWAQRP
ncbi:Uu.00g000600.m01.CDS01 [Anthostomella pinea]|uniref:Uu.00g000600.m01.CDS01 n=1 Tax=Anthostomella pinea TaxID=933095 RepID=A0AAI8VJ77_9PEZI|nr:Uu.00g000600.m01.CDS01 [Anthostomella pinea]